MSRGLLKHKPGSVDPNKSLMDVVEHLSGGVTIVPNPLSRGNARSEAPTPKPAERGAAKEAKDPRPRDE